MPRCACPTLTTLNDIPKSDAHGSALAETEDIKMEVRREVTPEICILNTPPPISPSRPRGWDPAYLFDGRLLPIEQLRQLPAPLIRTLTVLAEEAQDTVTIVTKGLPDLSV